VALELAASVRLVPSALREIDPRSSISLAVPACLAVPLGSVLLLVSGPDTAVHNRATLIVFFAMTQTVATLAFAFHGLLTGEVLWRTVLLAPVFVLGTHLGASWFHPGRERLYRRVALLLVAISGIAGIV